MADRSRPELYDLISGLEVVVTAQNRSAWVARCLGNSPASPLGEDDIDALLDVAAIETVPVNTVLFGRGDDVGDVYILERGNVALSRPSLDGTGQAGTEASVLQVLHPGDVFGDIALFLGRRTAEEALVIADAEVFRISGQDLVRLVSTRPRLAVRWMVSMAARLADSQDRLEQLLAGPLDLQLATLLSHAVDADGTVAVSQELLARLLGVRRTSVTRSLANLQRQGLIEKRYGRIDVLDRERLHAVH